MSEETAAQLRAMKEEMAALLMEKKRRIERNKLAAYAPYPKQLEFHNAGKRYRERLFMAGNQLGKTVAGAHETAIHLTGRYPSWWTGRRFENPVRAWAGGVTSETTRDTVQKLLVGQPEQQETFGTGAIPFDCIVEWTSARGIPNALDSVTVKHETGGTSTLLFKSYERGREKWQGDTLHFIWLDEEPPLDIYTEALTRTNATGGMVFLTFTPLLGMSEVVSRFLGYDLDPNDVNRIHRTVVQMGIGDALHYTQEQRQAIIASYPAHERDARARGEPFMGKGQVFPISLEAITVDPFPIPRHFAHIIGLDFGWDHPFAAVHLAYDRDSDIVYVCKNLRVREQTPVQHAAAIRCWSDCNWAPVAWPHDGLQHDKGSGVSLAAQYEAQGLNMLPEKATFPDGGNGLEAGVTAMLDRMMTGRWKVFSTCADWLQEARLYHRAAKPNGTVEIVRVKDDLLCLDGDTLVDTECGPRRIADMVGTEGRLYTFDGNLAPYRDCRMTRQQTRTVAVTFSDGSEVVCTPEHQFWTTQGWVEAVDLPGKTMHDSVSYGGRAECLSSLSLTTSKCSVRQSTGGWGATIGAAIGGFIEMCGRITTAKFRRAIMSITSTMTRTITGSKTSNASLAPSISQIMRAATNDDLARRSPHLSVGAPQLRASNSCVSKAGATSKTYELNSRSIAHGATRNSEPRLRGRTDFAPTSANPPVAATLGWMMRRAPARSAASASPSTNTPKRKLARVSAPLKSLSVREAGIRDVYCLDVAGTHALRLSNGVIAHNCASRYAMMMLRAADIEPVDYDDVDYREARRTANAWTGY